MPPPQWAKSKSADMVVAFGNWTNCRLVKLDLTVLQITHTHAKQCGDGAESCPAHATQCGANDLRALLPRPVEISKKTNTMKSEEFSCSLQVASSIHNN